jgi:hypothetical protein
LYNSFSQLEEKLGIEEIREGICRFTKPDTVPAHTYGLFPSSDVALMSLLSRAQLPDEPNLLAGAAGT